MKNQNFQNHQNQTKRLKKKDNPCLIGSMQNQKQRIKLVFIAEPETSLFFWEHDKAYMNLIIRIRTTAKLDNIFLKGNLVVGK